MAIVRKLMQLHLFFLFFFSFQILFSQKTISSKKIHFEPLENWNKTIKKFQSTGDSIFFDQWQPKRITSVKIIERKNNNSTQWLITDQRGIVWLWEPQKLHISVALDIRDKVRNKANEEGLLGIAHSKKNENFIYMCYSASSPRRNKYVQYILRKNTIDKKSEKVFMEVLQPFGNHNGGDIAFGKDEFLYIALGDGGSFGDPFNNAQNLNSLLGKILRIDITPLTQNKTNYIIPKDNPFFKKGNTSIRPEIWAMGLRNPWKISFDSLEGDLWTGDVGQNKWEEINLIEKGQNYGWKIKEGYSNYKATEKKNASHLTSPIIVHNRREARSITGGYVYRGNKISTIKGYYIYGDYLTGNIWAIFYNKKKKQIKKKLQLSKIPGIITFFEDELNELYLATGKGELFYLKAN